ncbi:hypothetical protein QK290_06830 [Pseudarthrobacter sp. AL07]|uniref:DUF6707 family protein n=1 Tax=unclassified Pseudarthrobacter TaxID=2647000 RepID=UPI00249B4BD8|nr:MULTISPECIES: DUF6707 family protein [unclassified Pseudarthrobacter]MDI3194173.1 hypothetical protein [Pseudarthrobacter sp. AL20]MDI3208239.1 hypothetical protein [Pseudarthrobacter sp. AL07]
MTENPASRHYSEQQAGSLTTGDQLLLPDGERTAEIQHVEFEPDDFGTPAVVLANLTGGGTLRIAAGSTVKILDPTVPVITVPDATLQDATPDAVTQLPVAAQPPAEQPQHTGDGEEAPAAPAVVVPPLPAIPPAVSGPSAEELARIPGPQGTPEAVVEAAAEAHPDAVGVLLLADKLAKGINFKSGSCLKDLSDLAHELFITLKDPDGALTVADLLNVLPFDGNPGRWASVEASLALSSFICRQDRQEERAEVYEKLLRMPENQETDPFKARMNAKVRQRSLNEPNLYDKEIFRSIDNSNHEAEREWRLLRLESLLFLRAHGGSETIGAGELQRRISNELEAVRA